MLCIIVRYVCTCAVYFDYVIVCLLNDPYIHTECCIHTDVANAVFTKPLVNIKSSLFFFYICVNSSVMILRKILALFNSY